MVRRRAKAKLSADGKMFNNLIKEMALPKLKPKKRKRFLYFVGGIASL